MKKKTVAFVLAMVLVFAVTVGITVAYLTDKTETITNTFTVGKVNIDLKETENVVDGKWEQKLIPGKEYGKNPTVKVVADSEDCWLFVKFVQGDAAKYISYTSNLTAENGWTKGDGTEIPADVWYRHVVSSNSDTEFELLANNTVTVKNTVTNENMTEAAESELVYTAYACQYEGFENDAAGAWTAVPKA